MATIDELLRTQQAQANALEEIAQYVRSLGGRLDARERLELQARLEGGAYPRSGALAGGAPAAGAGDVFQQATIAPDAITGTEIADGAVGMAHFASTIIPPRVVSSLPALPDSAYPQGSLVFLTTDQKLYRNTTGSAWSRATDGADIIADSITAGQIAAGAIGASEIAAAAVVASKIAVTSGTMPAGRQANGGFEILGEATPNVYGMGGVNPPGYVRVAESGAQVISSTSGQRSGTYCLVLSMAQRSGSGNIYGEVGPVAIEMGRRYRYRVYVRGYAGNSVNARGGIFIRSLNGDGTENGFLTPVGTSAITVGTNTAWQVIEGYFDVGSGTTAFVRLGCEMYNTSGSSDFMAFDDAEVHPLDDDVKHAAGNVTIDSTGIVVTNGKITVSNPSATVIIDGTSNMFKIAATGTLDTGSIADQAGATVTVDLTALAPQTNSLALVAMIGTTSGASDARRPMGYLQLQAATRFVASTSGGSPTTRALVYQLSSYAASSLVGAGTDTPRYTLAGQNESGSAKTFFSRYYMLKEAAI